MREQPLTLPDRPGEWGDVDHPLMGRYRQRWLPGAFGGRATIAGVLSFRVLKEQWDESTNPPSRTILGAQVVEEER